MLFSIIIPSYKRHFLTNAIESVKSQTFKDWELIIVDDCSPELLEEVVSPYLTDNRIRYIRNEQNYGAKRLVDNWNNCLRFCNGQYVICMGDDDMLPSDSLEEYSRIIEKYPEINIIHGQTEVINENGEVCELLEPRFEHENVLQLIYYRWAGLGRQQFIGDFCYNKNALIKSGGFYNLPLAWGSDDITAVIAASEYGIVNTQKVCFLYRKNRYSISSDMNNQLKADALQKQKEWYIQYLEQYKPKGTNELVTLRLLNKLLNQHFLRHTYLLVENDIRHNKRNIIFWLKNRKRFELTTKKIILQLIKSLKNSNNE